MGKQIKSRSCKYVVSLDEKDYYVVTSISKESAIRLVSAVTDTYRRNVEIKEIKVACSTGHNPPPKGGKPGEPGGAGGKKNKANRSIVNVSPIQKTFRPGVRFLISRTNHLQSSKRVKRVSPQEALALIEGKKITEKKKA